MAMRQAKYRTLCEVSDDSVGDGKLASLLLYIPISIYEYIKYIYCQDIMTGIIPCRYGTYKERISCLSPDTVRSDLGV